MPMDLLIHVGLHKTGTTTCQRALSHGAQELARLGILYPRTGLHADQHSQIPGGLIGRAADSGDSRFQDVELVLDQLHAELRAASPRLAIISSEVFSELIGDKEACLWLLGKLSQPFARTTILVSKRNIESQAISYLKHRFRAHFHPEIIDPVGSYQRIKREIKGVDDFWSQSGYELRVKYLEQRQGCLPDHYFGDLIEPYSEQARAVLQASASSLPSGGESENADTLNAGIYFVFLLLGNRPESPHLLQAPLLDWIREECSNAGVADLFAMSSKASVAILLRYLEALAAGLGADASGPAILPRARKLAALAEAGLDQAQIKAIDRAARRVLKRATPGSRFTRLLGWRPWRPQA